MSIFKQSFVERIKANKLWKKINRVYSDDIINIHIQSKWSHFAHYNESEIREWLMVCSHTDLIEYNVATHNAMQSMSETISKQQDWMKKIRTIRFRSPLYRTKE